MKTLMTFFTVLFFAAVFALPSYAHEGGEQGQGDGDGDWGGGTREVEGFISQLSDDFRIEINRLLLVAHKELSALKANSAGKFLEINTLLLEEKFDREKALTLQDSIAEDYKKINIVFMDFLHNFKSLFKNEKDKRKVKLFIANGLLVDYFKFLLFTPDFKLLQFPGFAKEETGEKAKEKGKKPEEVICLPAR